MNLTYYGHSCFSVIVAGRVLLFDPFITGNALASEIVDVDAVPADYILLSHGHFDHVGDTVRIAKRTGAMVICNFEVSEWLGKQGLTNVGGMNHGGGKDFDFGRVKLVNAIHSSVMPDGAYGGNPAGFLITSGEGPFYASGDTALTLDMQLIPVWAGVPLVFAAMCIGDHFTMGVEDAIRAAELVKAHDVVGLHYDTFPPIRLDRKRAMEKFAAAGRHLLLPAIGETIGF